MNRSNIRRAVESANRRIANALVRVEECRARLRAIQSECPHASKRTETSNVGRYVNEWCDDCGACFAVAR